MKSIPLSLLCLLWSLVEVQSQTEYPYISFRGTTLSNHSYVDLTQVREILTGNGNNTVQCHTDLSTCCRANVSIGVVGRGNWFAPGSDTRLPYGGELGDQPGIYEDRKSQVVHLRRKYSPNGPSGIYRCVIPTNAVHNNNNEFVGETVYVGLYDNRGSRGTRLYVTTLNDRLWKKNILYIVFIHIYNLLHVFC